MTIELTVEKTDMVMIRKIGTSNLSLAFGGLTETSAIESSIPVGKVISYAGAEMRTRRLICTGSNVSRSTYSKLFSITGTLYRIADNMTTFNLLASVLIFHIQIYQKCFEC